MIKIFKNLLFLVLFFCISLFIVSRSVNVYAQNESQSAIYFDDSGNFVFSAYDRIATGNVVYSTVGWIIKKYNEPIGAAGQISVVIPLPSYSYEIIDKDNPGYKYSYFVMKGEQVLGYISSVSQAWADYLKKYGGTVYLDSVMTVEEKGVPKGGVDSAGVGYGEVYIDYNGISTARGWADPYCLLDYFNIPVAFPSFVKKPEGQILKDSLKTEKIAVGGSVMAGIALGSHEMGYEKYDTVLGIPSGEDIYVYGLADRYYEEGELLKNTGVVNVPVKVTTDYILKWTDTAGRDRTEKVRVYRYYYVQKSFEYYTVNSFRAYELAGVTLEGECTGRAEYNINVPKLKIDMRSYGNYENHITITEGSIYGGEKTIYSSDNRRPDIPDENQEELAKASGASIKVRNDGLYVEGKALLSEEWVDKGTYNKSFQNQKEIIYKTGLIIHEKMPNGEYKDTRAVYKYVWGNDVKSISVNGGILTVHTPIVCGTGVSAPKKYNMSVKPKGNQLVAGTDFSIICKNTGMHRDIKGYGERNYSIYMDKGYVRFPFEIIMDNKKYSKNTWIEVRGTGAICYIPESVPLGSYRIEYAALARNSSITDISSAISNGVIGDGANTELTQYGALSTIDVEVIGTISGFSAECNERTAYVGSRIGFYGKAPDNTESMPLAIKEAPLSYRVKVRSCGIGEAPEDKLIGDISYYYIKNGERYEADVYISGSHNILGRMSYDKVTDRVEFGEDNKRQTSEGVYLWEKDIALGENLLVMPKGIKPDSEEIVNQYAFRDGNILINFDINGYSGNNWEYSYINVENSPRGHCNMWKTEGYLYNFVDRTGSGYNLADGDGIVIEINGGIYEDYEIVGTH